MGDGPRGITGLVELAYAAALDDRLWWRWAEEAIGVFGVQGALFWVIDTERAEMSRSQFHFRDVDLDSLASEYLSGPVNQDPQMRRVLAARQSEVYSDLDHVDLDSAEDREYVAWQYAHVGTTHHLTASVALNDTLKAGIALHTSPEVGPTSAAQRAALIALLPHFARSLKLGLRHNELIDEARWQAAEGPQTDAGILLDENEKVIRLSEAAERMLGARDGLTVTDGRLCALDAMCDAQLRAAVAQAVRDRQPRSGAATLVRRSGRKPYLVIVYPLVRERRFLAPRQAAALVHLVDPCAVAMRLSPIQQTLFSLTEREAEVASLLLAGHSPESLAAVLGISRNTARVHLQSLFRKTGANRQSDVVRILRAAH